MTQGVIETSLLRAGEMKVSKVFLAAVTVACTLIAADVQNGKTVYERACRSCHGLDGTPNPAIAKMFRVEMRSLPSRDVQATSDDEIKKIIADGKGKMRPVKTVAGSSLDDVVAYVRSLKK